MQGGKRFEEGWLKQANKDEEKNKGRWKKKRLANEREKEKR